MKKTIIHVGLHKTATTFLQGSVWPEIRGYTYLSRPYTQHNHAFNQLQYADDTLYRKDLLVNELKNIDANNLLMSDESFSGKPVYFSYLNRSLIANRLADLFPKAEIILFLRDQKDILLSHYSSYVQMPYGTKPIESLFYRPRTNYTYADYLNDPDRYDMRSLYYNTNDYFIHLDCFLYAPLVDLYNSLFDKCHVFLYEEFRENRTKTISRLEEIVGEHIQLKSTTPTNVSLSHSKLEKRRKENLVSFVPEKRYLRKLAGIAVTATSSKRHRDLKALVHEIAGDHYSGDNRVLKNRLPHLGWDKHPDKYA